MPTSASHGRSRRSALHVALPGATHSKDPRIRTFKWLLGRGLSISNEAPLELDFAAVKSGITRVDARTTVALARLRDSLKELLEEHLMVSSVHEKNLFSELSPLRRIPPEVLDQIFSWTLPSVDQALDHKKRPMAGSTNQQPLESNDPFDSARSQHCVT
ncbi:hypothetical protein B0H17DRAFT_1133490 [Mycena rosella]|uniref:Uncharacterized protein n=1 Tax=Mycena rosella TaxID=1033263 RepID=A0AAD7DIZ1_MYCRO|nr:hypothetical protein B0H17DRAFT_1133490 [Mycena rosella]